MTSERSGRSTDASERDWSVHPGEILREKLDEIGMSQSYLAFALGYTQKHVNQVVKGHVRISADMAVRLERELDISARFWLHMQADHDLFEARAADALRREDRS